MRTLILAAVLAVAAPLHPGGPSGTYVAPPDGIGLAVLTDWSVSVDLDARTMTVHGEVTNRSDHVLANVTASVWDEDTVTADVEPQILMPGASGVFTATLYTGTNLTAYVFVEADVMPVEPAPWRHTPREGSDR